MGRGDTVAEPWSCILPRLTPFHRAAVPLGVLALCTGILIGEKCKKYGSETLGQLVGLPWSTVSYGSSFDHLEKEPIPIEHICRLDLSIFFRGEPIEKGLTFQGLIYPIELDHEQISQIASICSTFCCAPLDGKQIISAWIIISSLPEHGYFCR